VTVHPGTRGLGIDLDEQLADHVSSQPLTDTGELPGGFRGAALAAQPDFRTELGIIVVRGSKHVVNIMPLTLTPSKGFEEGFTHLNCGSRTTPIGGEKDVKTSTRFRASY
jgi:hypothetical protein